jgi:hypothetical protein
LRKKPPFLPFFFFIACSRQHWPHPVLVNEKREDIPIEMYNEVLADNSAMIQGGANTSNDLPSLEKDPILNRIRKVLIVLIGINFVSKSNENRFKNII